MLKVLGWSADECTMSKPNQENDLQARWEADAREEALAYDEEVSRWGVADRWDHEPWTDADCEEYDGADDEEPLGLFNEDGTWNYDREDLSGTPF